MSRAIAAIWGSHGETASLRFPGQPFGATGTAIAKFFKELTRDALSTYRPEKHYMRGPGPACQAKYGKRPAQG